MRGQCDQGDPVLLLDSDIESVPEMALHVILISSL